MANVVSIRIVFEDAQSAERALPVAARMIKLEYLPKALPWADEAARIAPFSERYFRFGEVADALDPLSEHPNCALKWLRREGAALLLARCADIQSPVDAFRPGDFFTQLCLTLSKCFPEAHFCAFCRHEETVSATVQLNRLDYDGRSLVYWEMWSLDEEIDEDDWSRAYLYVLHEQGGIIESPAAGR